MNSAAKTTMTKVAALDYVLTNCEMPQEVAEKLDSMRAQLMKRNSTSSAKPTATQRENVGVKENLLRTLENADRPLTAGEVWQESPDLVDFRGHDGKAMSAQRITALLTQLVKEKTVVRTVIKGKAYFSLSEVEEG
jgi:hypothetical protein